VIHTGLQDERLLPTKGNPATTFFQKVFLKAGRFTTQWVRLDFDTRPAFNTAATLTLPRIGNLITRLYLVTTMPDIYTPQMKAQQDPNFKGPVFGWTNSLGHALLTQATIDIAGSRVEQLNGRLLEVLDEFQTPLEKVTSMNKLLPRLDSGFTTKSFGWSPTPTVATTPLPFWFCKGDPGAAFPIDAVNADQVRLTIGIAPVGSLYVSSSLVDTSGNTVDLTNKTTRTSTAVIESGFCATGNNTTYPPLEGATFTRTDGTKITGTTIPSKLVLGDTYVMAEYVYLDKPEANKFRIADFQYPIVQHYLFDPVDTFGQPRMTLPLRVPNPCRDLYFYAQRYEAASYNAPFLATRDLNEADKFGIWWPDAHGLNTQSYQELVPAFSERDSEPFASVSLIYEGKLSRYSSSSPSVFRSLISSYEQRKSPWVNRYMYNMTFGFQNGLYPPSVVTGEANLDKIEKLELQVQMQPFKGSQNPTNVPRYLIYVFAETYNVLRVYGGRAGLLFGY
jgi:hypothetical protein